MKTNSKLVFIIATLASLVFTLTVKLQEVAAIDYHLTIINNSTQLYGHIFEKPPELIIHGTYDHNIPNHPELGIHANFDDSLHSDPELHIHIDHLKP
jgi:hypothetical protein